MQHPDPVHPSALAELLERATQLPVREISDEVRLEANQIYVIPPNTTLRIAHNCEDADEARRSAEANAKLGESEGLLRHAQAAAHIGTFDLDLTTGVNTWTPELEAMHGLAPKTFPIASVADKVRGAAPIDIGDR